MKMPIRHVYLNFQIDTNRINAKSGLNYMNILEHWHEEDVIHLDMAEVAQIEATQGNSAIRTQKAYSYISSETLASTPIEQEMLRKIQNILSPAGVSTSGEWNDIEIVFNAQKYGRILISNDGGSKRQPGGILGNCNNLSAIGIKILRDSESVELVKTKIIQRDKTANLVASVTGEEVPFWVGKDLDIIAKNTTK